MAGAGRSALFGFSLPPPLPPAAAERGSGNHGRFLRFPTLNAFFPSRRKKKKKLGGGRSPSGEDLIKTKPKPPSSPPTPALPVRADGATERRFRALSTPGRGCPRSAGPGRPRRAVSPEKVQRAAAPARSGLGFPGAPPATGRTSSPGAGAVGAGGGGGTSSVPRRSPPAAATPAACKRLRQFTARLKPSPTVITRQINGRIPDGRVAPIRGSSPPSQRSRRGGG